MSQEQSTAHGRKPPPRWYAFAYGICGALVGIDLANGGIRSGSEPGHALALALLAHVLIHRYGRGWMGYVTLALICLCACWLIYSAVQGAQ